LPLLLLLLQVRVQLLPEEQRPDFSAMLGGVQLQEVFLTLRSKTDRLVLKDASMTVTAGQAVIITSECSAAFIHCLLQDGSWECLQAMNGLSGPN
jgi:hypothetical protein